MSDIISLQNLAGSVSAVEQSMEPTRLKVLYHSNCNSSNLSEYHIKFSQLMNKYSGWAEQYRSELNQFHKLLLTTIKLKQLKEKEKLERLEVMSVSNLEIVDNEPIEYSPANSIANQQTNSSSDQHSEPEPETESIKTAPVKTEIVTAPNKPKPKPKPKPIKATKQIKAVKAVKPVPVPAPIKATKPTKSVKKNNNKKQTKNKSRKNATKNIPKPVAQKKENSVEENKEENTENKTEENKDKPYEYNAKTISYRCFSFNGVQKSSTLIYIGNLPWNLPQQTTDEQVQELYNSKIAALQYFVKKKAKVGMMQIEETQLKHGWNGMYAIVRFRSDVSLNKVTKFINTVNEENSKFAEERKKEANKLEKTGKKNKNINGDKTSWKRRVFVKFNNNFRFYESEDAMYQDPSARHTLFIRNFDILNDKCHQELTYKLLEFGDLYNDIEIRVDRYGDPYCTVTFKYINDAIYCCNSEINFNERMLEMRYSKF